MDRCVLGSADGAQCGDAGDRGDMMPREARGFQCEFCPRMFGSLVDAVKHETVCKFNPSMRRCYTCKHGEFMFEEVHDEFTSENGDHTLACYFSEYYGCKHFGQPIVRDLKDIDFYSDGDRINPALPRPGTCAFWEWKNADA